MQAAKLEVLIASAVICSGSMPSLLNPSKCLDSVASRWLVGREMGGPGYFREILVQYDYISFGHMGIVWVCFPEKVLIVLIAAKVCLNGRCSGTTFTKNKFKPFPLEGPRILRVCWFQEG